jgi:FkbM family methyltransferase
LETRTKNYLQKLITYKLLGGKAYKHLKFYKQFLKYRIGLSYELSDLMRKILKPGDVFFDVGANLGQYIFRFRSFENSSLIIYAFEPVISNYEMVIRRIRNNSNVILEKTALSDKNCNSVLYIPLIDGIEIDTQASLNLENRQIYYKDFKKQDIQLSTLDEYCKNNSVTRIDLLKIDTEGNDDKVVEGGRRIILESKPVIMAEDIIGTESFYCLHKNGYRSFLADKNMYLHSYNSDVAGLVKDLTIMIHESKINLISNLFAHR